MEDRCVVCGHIVPEGTWVCPNCNRMAQGAPCRECVKKSPPDCHCYCKTYTEWAMWNEKRKAMLERERKDAAYFIKKTIGKKQVMEKRGSFD